ncbi:discoidin domain-containing protein [Mucilaginibacter mali]|uniref:Discoidin domain-containing protein n=1 Tax=Mucilaginibacter mali TaxID=2740462 RepID=A0A7D4UE08_9SPHI|nr:M60 family metallopeptidase [Mucilaginibacter mali]QKJ31079.1 discoidin domain-containing protein [Mucilaginibacter mali]
MNSNRFLNFIAILLLAGGFTACKKYGIAVPDGYEDASQNQKSITVDTNMANIDRSGYAKARVFPGLVDQTEPRVTNQKFTLDLNFTAQTADNLRIQVAPQAQYSTGYYAAPGELIKLVVPAGINGLSMQIGGQTDDLTGKAPLLRDPIIFNRQELYPGVNYMRNIYGGTIYISASFAIPTPVEFTISGAVVSPDFILGVDTHDAWKARVLASKVPWLELRSKRVVFLVPRDKIVSQFNSTTEPLTNIAEPLSLWNTVFDVDYNGWMGLSDNAADTKDRSPQGQWRGVLDIQLSAGYGHNGFPFVGLNDMEWFSAFTSATRLKTSVNTWGSYHEFGHNCQQPTVWSWSTLGETTNNLFSFKVANRINANYNTLHPSVSSGFPLAITYASTAGTKNFDSDAAIDDPFKRMTPFVQIFELYGYGAMTKLYTEARHAQRLANNDQDKHDFVYEKLSEYCNTDLIPFFEAWGILISTQSQAKIGLKYPLLNKQIWTYNPLNKTGGTAAIVYTTTVLSASSPAQEGSTAALVDNNLTTYFHSQYTNPTPAQSYPFTFILSAGANMPIKGMYFNGRAGTNRAGDAKEVEIFSSRDNINYTSIGTTILPNSPNRYEYNFPNGNVNAKYFKVVVKSGYTTNPYVVFAEMNLIKP